MHKQAIIATGLTVFGIFLAIFSHADFLIPYKRQLFAVHGTHMLIYTALLAVNLFAVYRWLSITFRLQGTGVHLSHMDKQIRDGHGSIARELSERLRKE